MDPIKKINDFLSYEYLGKPKPMSDAKRAAARKKRKKQQKHKKSGNR